MLDESQIFLLNLIISKSSDGYAVLDKDDLIISFPKTYLLTEESLNDAFSILANSGFIKIKYNDGKTFCAIATEKGIDYSEFTNKQVKQSKISKKSVFAVLFLGGFLGALLGSVFASIILFIILRGL